MMTHIASLEKEIPFTVNYCSIRHYIFHFTLGHLTNSRTKMIMVSLFFLIDCIYLIPTKF